MLSNICNLNIQCTILIKHRMSDKTSTQSFVSPLTPGIVLNLTARHMNLDPIDF